MRGKRFEFCDWLNEEQHGFHRRALAARSRLHLRELRASGVPLASMMLREGVGERFHPLPQRSLMISPAAMCAELVREDAEFD